MKELNKEFLVALCSNNTKKLFEIKNNLNNSDIEKLHSTSEGLLLVGRFYIETEQFIKARAISFKIHTKFGCCSDGAELELRILKKFAIDYIYLIRAEKYSTLYQYKPFFIENYALALSRVNRFQSAKKQLDRLKKVQKTVATDFLESQIFWHEDKRPEALAILSKLLIDDPNNIQVVRNYIRLLLETGERDSAKKALQDNIEKFKDCPAPS